MAHQVVRSASCAVCLGLAVLAGTRLAGAQATPGVDRPMPYMQAVDQFGVGQVRGTE